jgi:hypothetical protein
MSKEGCCNVWVSGRAIVQAAAIDGCNKVFCACIPLAQSYI